MTDELVLDQHPQRGEVAGLILAAQDERLVRVVEVQAHGEETRGEPGHIDHEGRFTGGGGLVAAELKALVVRRGRRCDAQPAEQQESREFPMHGSLVI